MIKQQKQISIKNVCNAIFDEQKLISAILWYTNKPVYRVKNVYIHGKYPAVSVYDKKIHIHRLLLMFHMQSDIDSDFFVHHKDGNKLNASLDNLELMEVGKHQSLHNAGKILSIEHRQKIAEANKKRKGIKIKKRVDMPDLGRLVKKGWSTNKIAKYYGCDWSTVKNRISESPELMEDAE